MKITPEACLRPNTPAVVCEIIDGEAIFVNFDTGHYYSLDQAGAEIWRLAEQGRPVAIIIDRMTQFFQGDRTAVTSAVTNFLQKLVEENLLVPDHENPSGTSKALHPEDPPQPDRTYSIESLVLNKYSDMQEMLLIDPIHEVDEQGWPNPGGLKSK